MRLETCTGADALCIFSAFSQLLSFLQQQTSFLTSTGPPAVNLHVPLHTSWPALKDLSESMSLVHGTQLDEPHDINKCGGCLHKAPRTTAKTVINIFLYKYEH